MMGTSRYPVTQSSNITNTGLQSEKVIRNYYCWSMDHGKVHSEVYGLTSSWGDDEPPRNQVFYLKGLSLAMQVKLGEFGSFFFKAHLQSITTLRPDSTFFFVFLPVQKHWEPSVHMYPNVFQVKSSWMVWPANPPSACKNWNILQHMLPRRPQIGASFYIASHKSIKVTYLDMFSN